MRIVLFLLIIFLALPVYADDEAEDCTLGIEAIESHIDFKSPAIKTVLPAKRVDRHLEESVILQNGMIFTFDVGGCAHYAFNLRWDDVPLDLEKDQFALAKKLLADAPLHDKGPGGPRPMMAEALDKAKTPNELPCGTDAYCHLIVNEKPNKTLSVTLMYDFAL